MNLEDLIRHNMQAVPLKSMTSLKGNVAIAVAWSTGFTTAPVEQTTYSKNTGSQSTSFFMLNRHKRSAGDPPTTFLNIG